MPELDKHNASYFASLMGVLWWIIELGCIDIIVEVGLLARFQLHREKVILTNFSMYSLT